MNDNILANQESESLTIVKGFVRSTLIKSGLIGCVTGIVLIVGWSLSIGLGFLAGVVLSMVNFQLMSLDAYTIGGKPSSKAFGFIMGRYFVRYGIMTGGVVLIAVKTSLNLIAVCIGIFIVQSMLLGEKALKGIISAISSRD